MTPPHKPKRSRPARILTWLTGTALVLALLIGVAAVLFDIQMERTTKQQHQQALNRIHTSTQKAKRELTRTNDDGKITAAEMKIVGNRVGHAAAWSTKEGTHITVVIKFSTLVFGVLGNTPMERCFPFKVAVGPGASHSEVKVGKRVLCPTAMRDLD